MSICDLVCVCGCVCVCSIRPSFSLGEDFITIMGRDPLKCLPEPDCKLTGDNSSRGERDEKIPRSYVELGAGERVSELELCVSV